MHRRIESATGAVIDTDGHDHDNRLILPYDLRMNLRLSARACRCYRLSPILRNPSAVKQRGAHLGRRAAVSVAVRGPTSFLPSTDPSRFTCKPTDFRSGAKGIRTPDLRRAKTGRHFAGPFRRLQNSCKQAHLLLYRFSCCFRRFTRVAARLLRREARSPSCIDAREQRKLATWTLLFPFCPRTPHVSNLHGGAGLSTLATGGREASRWMIGLGA
jgi:hypothetical protein